jgi:YVTN family beta-propeller protein
VDTASNTVVQTIPVSNGPLAVSITPDGRTAFVSEYYGAATAVINLASNTVVASVPVGATPYGSALTPDGAFVWQTSWSASSISVISTADNTVVTTIPVSGYDFNVAIGPTTSLSDLTNALTNTVNGFSLQAGTANSLDVKLRAVQASLAASDFTDACIQIGSFISEVMAQSGKRLTVAQANQLIAQANVIKTGLGCP